MPERERVTRAHDPDDAFGHRVRELDRAPESTIGDRDVGACAVHIRNGNPRNNGPAKQLVVSGMHALGHNDLGGLFHEMSNTGHSLDRQDQDTQEQEVEQHHEGELPHRRTSPKAHGAPSICIATAHRSSQMIEVVRCT